MRNEQYITESKNEEQRYREYLNQVQKENTKQVSQDDAIATSLMIQIDVDSTERMYQEPQSEEEQQQIFEERMKESAENYAERQQYHLVRSAMLRCTCGSHCRQLNLRVTHNVFDQWNNPLVNEYDSIPIVEGMKDLKYNIPAFGVCNSVDNTNESIIFKKDYLRDESGKKISDERMKGNVKGPKCIPEILTTWLCPHEGTNIDGGCAISLNSYLVCAYGGLIEVLNSGQQEDTEKESL